MSEGPSNVQKFRSTVEVDGATYTSSNTFFTKKKKKNSQIRRCQSYTRTRIKEDKGWKMSPRL